MQLWRVIRPGSTLTRLGDATAGCALAAFVFDYYGASTLPVFLAVILASGLLHAGGRLWEGAFDPALARRLVHTPGAEGATVANTPIFFAAAGLTAMAWLLAMSQGLVVFYAAFAVGLVHIVHAAAARWCGPAGPLVHGVARGGHLLAGLAAYPLLHLTGLRPARVAPVVALALWFAAADAPRPDARGRVDRFGLWLAFFGLVGSGAAFAAFLPVETAATGPWAEAKTWLPAFLGAHMAWIATALAGALIALGMLVAAARADAEGAARLRRNAAAGGVLLEFALAAGASHGWDGRPRASFLIPLGLLAAWAVHRAWKTRIPPAEAA